MRRSYYEFLSTPSVRRATLWQPDGLGWIRRFLSTPSVRRATHGCGHCDPDRPISIHALREEGDLWAVYHRLGGIQFLSTPSVRRATRSLWTQTRLRLYFYPRPP